MAARETLTTEIEIIPDPLQPQFRILFKRDNKRGIAAIYQSADGGVTYTILLPVPSASDKVGSVPTLTANGVEWLLPSVTMEGATTTAANSQNSGLTFVDMYLGDEVFLNAIFGYFKVPAGFTFVCREIQLSCMTPPDTTITLDTIDQNGVLLGNTVSLPASFRTRTTVLTTPFTMSAGSTWALKVIACGTVAPGENLSARLILQLP